MVGFAERQYLFRQGEQGDVAYLIEAGRVEVLVDEEFGSRQIATLGPGEMVGEMALVDGSPRSASVRTLEPSNLLVLTRETIERRLKASDPVVNLMLQSVMVRLRAASNVADTVPAHSPSHEATKQEARAAAIAHIGLIHDLEKGLAGNEVNLFYQPILRLNDKRLVGYEALARWRHPHRGFIPTAEFIPIAEANGLTRALARRCINVASNDLPGLDAAARRLGGDSPICLYINVSGNDIGTRGFIDGLVAEAGSAARQITLELTETALINEPSLAREALDLARKAGFKIAIDDFGAGNASLQYLRDFPIDIVKLDKSFIQSGDDSSNAMEIVRSLLALSRSLGLTSIVEGVEDEHQLAAATRLGADYAQGYYLGRPMPIGRLSNESYI